MGRQRAPRVLTVELVGAGDRTTTVVVEHTALPFEDSRAAHAAGWEGVLDTLAGEVLA